MDRCKADGSSPSATRRTTCLRPDLRRAVSAGTERHEPTLDPHDPRRAGPPSADRRLVVGRRVFHGAARLCAAGQHHWPTTPSTTRASRSRRQRDPARLWSAEDGLYYRDESYFNATTPAGAPVFWARGNAGRSARWRDRSPSRRRRTRRTRSTRRSSARSPPRSRALQGADGMWRASLLDPQNPPNAEATGTAGFAFGIAYGVNAGLLDAATYRSIAEAPGASGDARPRFRRPRPLPAGGRAGGREPACRGAHLARSASASSSSRGARSTGSALHRK